MTHPPLAERIAEYQAKERQRRQQLLLFLLTVIGTVALASYLFLTIKSGSLPFAQLWQTEKKQELVSPAPLDKTKQEKDRPAPKQEQKQKEEKHPNKREKIRVHLLNGAPDETKFLELAEALKTLGYQVETGKAQYDSYTELNLGLKQDSQEVGELMRQDLNKIFPQTRIDDLPDIAETSEFDVVIIVGTLS